MELWQLASDLGVPSLVGLVVWFGTRNDRESFERVHTSLRQTLEVVEKDRDYWRRRAIRCETGARWDLTPPGGMEATRPERKENDDDREA